MNTPPPDHELIVAEESDHGERLDRFVHARNPELSRSRCKELIKQGCVRTETGDVEAPNYRVKPGDRFRVRLPEPVAAEPRGEDIALNIAYEDDALIVVDKPDGLVVHPAAGNWTGTLVNALIAHCGDSLSGIGGVRRPGIVHRLDKETSGLLVVAKTDQAHQHLAALFADHGRSGGLERSYRALCWQAPPRRRGTIDAALGRKTTNRQKMAVVAHGGKHAVTHYQVLETIHDDAGAALISLVECRLETGRTHQIRVHMAHIGHPLLGDAVYGAHFAASRRRLPDSAGDALARLGRQALHAAVLGFAHPVSGEYLRFESPLPEEIEEIIIACRKPV